MKNKFILLTMFICLVMLTGCSNINNMSLDKILSNGTARTVKVYNKFRQGYKYNVPKGIDCIDNTPYNEVLASRHYTYYLYVDAVSYYNKVIDTYKVSDKAYYSKEIVYKDMYGYLEINKLDKDKYFIEIMYNYAKIEVIVKLSDINVTVANCMSVLTSIKFDDNILGKLLDENISQFNESNFNIFETTSSTESEYLQAVEENVYEEDDEEVHDNDLID